MNSTARILIAGDDIISRRIVSLIFSKAGYEVIEAANGHEGIEKVDSSMSLVLLDVMMPVTSGYDALNTICQSFSGLPVVMFSGGGKVEDFIETVREGAYWYLHKPLEPKESGKSARAFLSFSKEQ